MAEDDYWRSRGKTRCSVMKNDPKIVNPYYQQCLNAAKDETGLCWAHHPDKPDACKVRVGSAFTGSPGGRFWGADCWPPSPQTDPLGWAAMRAWLRKNSSLFT